MVWPFDFTVAEPTNTSGKQITLIFVHQALLLTCFVLQ